MLDTFLKQRDDVFCFFFCSRKLSISIQIYLQWVWFPYQEIWACYSGNVMAMEMRCLFPSLPVRREWNLFSGQMQAFFFRNCQIILWHLVTRAFCSGKLHAHWAQLAIPIKFPHAQNYAWLTCMAWPQQVYTPGGRTWTKIGIVFRPHVRSVSMKLNVDFVIYTL